MTVSPGSMIAALAREELARAYTGRDTAVTIGKFDGVHRGHGYLVQRLLDLASQENLATVVVTFNPNPVTVLRPGTPVTYLCSLEDRVELLRGLGIDAVSILFFTSQLAQLSPRDFVSLLIEELRMRLLLVGPDFGLGRNREGNVQHLRQLSSEMGFRLEVLPMLVEKGVKVGSHAVRDALAKGDMETATDLLGRPFTLCGPVVKGAERGRGMGFPTANIAIGLDQALPSFGIYVTRAHICGPAKATYPSVTSIGIRPTFGEDQPIVEAYILDFEGDIYGQEMRLEVLHCLRPEERFSSVDALVAAIQRDVEATREYFHAQG